ncbi:MAG: hypothetical protein JXR83_02460 [Deltaproteobacteria bacterium]|nr:hypothetical protein [Deltaproteobacteria bacterium]
MIQRPQLEVPERPKLRADLVFAPAVERGEHCTYVRDPRTRRFFRLGESARRAAQQMDGTRDSAAIAAKLTEQLGVELPVDPIRTLVAQLARLGFLENGPPPEPAPRVSGNAFFLVVPLLDPERFLSRLGWLWRKLVSPATALAIAVLISAGFAITGWWLWSGALPTLGELGAVDLVGFYLCVSLAVAGHELAHAVVLKRFGGEVHEMGLLLLYLQPCLYCNVSDSYLLPRRSRLWVSFAGIYFELGTWGAATVVAAALGTASAVGRWALLVTTAVGLKSLLFNLNPLIKLDGYYLLVDLLEMPNLRQRAFGHLADKIGGLAGRAPTTAVRDARESRILLGYAVLASLFLVVLFALVTWRLLAIVHQPRLTVSTLLVAALALFLLFRGVRFVSATLRGKRVEPIPGEP